MPNECTVTKIVRILWKVTESLDTTTTAHKNVIYYLSFYYTSTYNRKEKGLRNCP